MSSGLQIWFPTPPQGWTVKPLKRLVTMRAGEGITSEGIEVEGGYPVYGGNGVRGFTDGFTHEGRHVLIGRQGALCGNVHLAEGRFWASEHAVVASALPGASAPWLRYLLTSMNLGQYSMTAAQPGLSVDFIRDLPAPTPDLAQQQQISNFLDRETTKIDTLIVKQQRLISNLSERRAALLLRATMDPEHDWLQVRVGHVLRKLERQPSDVAVVITAYRDGQVTSRENRRDDGYTLSFTEKDYQRVHTGDLVFHALDGFAGAVGVSDSDGKCTPVYHVCEPLDDSSANYLAFHLRALGQTGFLIAFAWSVRQRSVDYRNWTLFASLPICVPPSDIQSGIATKLAQETAKIDGLVEKARELIAVMKERRAALVSAAVTGQIDVMTYVKGAERGGAAPRKAARDRDL